MSMDAIKICNQVLQTNMEGTEILVGIAFPGQHRILEQLNLLDDYLLTLQDRNNHINNNTNNMNDNKMDDDDDDDDIQSITSSAASISDTMAPTTSSNNNAAATNSLSNNDLPIGWRVVRDKRTNRNFYMNRYDILRSIPSL